MSRYVPVAILEIDNEGYISTELSTGESGTKVDIHRDIDQIEGKVPFMRFGIVDRGRRNKVVFSTYNFEKLLETLASFRGVNSRNSPTGARREARLLQELLDRIPHNVWATAAQPPAPEDFELETADVVNHFNPEEGGPDVMNED